MWNGPWAQLNAASLAYWEELLRRGVRRAAVGGSDTHYLHRSGVPAGHLDALGTPTTWVDAGDRPTVATILAALRDGRSFVSASPRGPQLYLEPDRGRAGRVAVEVRDGAGASLDLITAARAPQRLAVDSSAWDATFDVPAGTGFVRAQLRSASGDVLALSNPVWADRL